MNEAATACPSCAAASVSAVSGAYHSNCQGCQVRSIAHGMQFFDSRQAGAMTAGYRAALRAVFGPDRVKDGHAAVKAEWARLDGLRADP